MVNKLKERLILTNEESIQLEKSVIDTKDYVKFDLPEDNPTKKKFLILLGRVYKDLNEEVARELIEIIENKK